MKKYVIIQWPDSQQLMDHERFSECHLINSERGIEEFDSCAFFVPEDLFEEVFKPEEKLWDIEKELISLRR